MKKLLRSAVVVTSSIAAAGCAGRVYDNPPRPESTAPDTANQKKTGAHPQDAEGHYVFRKDDGTCYVQVEKTEPPPKDLMSGERWVEDKTLVCPKEFDEKEFAAIQDGHIWIQDETTGECSQAAEFGNPPPPPMKVDCPPSLKKK